MNASRTELEARLFKFQSETSGKTLKRKKTDEEAKNTLLSYLAVLDSAADARLAPIMEERIRLDEKVDQLEKELHEILAKTDANFQAQVQIEDERDMKKDEAISAFESEAGQVKKLRIEEDEKHRQSALDTIGNALAQSSPDSSGD